VIPRLLRALRATAGFDQTHLDALTVQHRGQLTIIALAAWLSAGTMGTGLGALALLATDSVFIAVASFVMGTFFTLNLHRLGLAASALPLEQATVRAEWTPSWGPLIIAFAVGSILSQPLLVVSYAATHDDTLGHARAAMVALHKQSLVTQYTQRLEELDSLLAVQAAELGEVQARIVSVPPLPAPELLSLRRTRRRLQETHRAKEAQRERLESEFEDAIGPALASYEDHLAASTLMVQRLRIAWGTPVVAAMFTLAVVLSAIGPIPLRWTWSASTVRYLEERHALERALVSAYHDAARKRASAALRKWRSFGGHRPAWLDAPFDTEAAPPLRPQRGDNRLEDCTVAQVLARLPTR